MIPLLFDQAPPAAEFLAQVLTLKLGEKYYRGGVGGYATQQPSASTSFHFLINQQQNTLNFFMVTEGSCLKDHLDLLVQLLIFAVREIMKPTRAFSV